MTARHGGWNREAAKGKNQHGLPSWLAMFAHQRGRGWTRLVCWDAQCRSKLSFSDSEKYFKSARYSIPIFSDILVDISCESVLDDWTNVPNVMTFALDGSIGLN